MTTRERIEEIKREGYDIDFGDVFNKSFEIYKRIALNAGIAIILFAIVMIGIVLGIVGVYAGFGSFSQSMTGFNPLNFSIIGIIAYIAGTVLFSAILSPFFAGIIKMADLANKQEDFSIGTVFDYYKSAYFKELFIATALISVFSVVISTISEGVGAGYVGTIVTCIISFFTFLAVPLIIFGNLNAIDAIKGSFTIVSKQILVLLGLIIVAIIIMFLGIIGFCIGIFFTMPFVYANYYAIYDAIIGTEKKDELDEIGMHLE